MIYVLSDIHGNRENFNAILEKIKLTEKDTLYILGDVIDPNGIDILKEIMKNKNFKMTLGNHEYLMLQALKDENNLSAWYSRKGEPTNDEFGKLSDSEKEEIVTFLKNLPLHYEITVNDKAYWLTHCLIKNSLGITDSIIKFNRIENDLEINDDYTVIFGHTPTKYYQNNNPLEVFYGENRIGIDCGSSYPKDSEFKGRLCCIRLDDMKVFYSE